VLTGIRRSGKSTTLTQFINILKTEYKIEKQRIIYLDFNDARVKTQYT
jgi:predicted AAA+ superfamily ATPase